jgi:tripartite-type tricarboxylate transporter receptor subunit TctC
VRTALRVLRKPVFAAACAAITVMSVAGCASSLTPTGAGGAAPGSQPDFSYFKGKTITYDVVQPPGGTFYVAAQILAPIVAKYLHATVNVVSVPAGNGVAGQDQVATSAPDGLTVGTLNLGVDLENQLTNTPSINFDLKKITVVAGLPINPDVFITAPNSPYKTWNDVIDSKTSIKSLDYAGPVDEVQQVLFGAYQTPVQLIQGYTSSADEVAGFLRGDGPVALQSSTAVSSAIAAGKARPLLVTGPVFPGSQGYGQLKNLQTLASFYASDKPKTASGNAAIKELIALFGAESPNQTIFAAPGTPASLTNALTAAFKYALGQPTTRSKELQQALTPGYYSPAVVTSLISGFEKNVGLMKQYVKS